MIPKIIHYIWFGKNQLPEDAVKCIKSWKKYCPDYKIIEWNEDNFDISMCPYIEEAYKAKKWAFVSDYVRLQVLFQYGGIYMDTDVEVIKPLDRFLSLKAFSGFETKSTVPTGIIACEKGHPFVGELIKEYDGLHFIDKDGNYDLTTNVTRITKKCIKNGLILNNTKQEISGFTFFPNDYFCPLSHETGSLNKTANTYTIHWFAGSWKQPSEKKAHEVACRIRQKYPGSFGMLISSFYESSIKVFSTLQEGGFLELRKRIGRYIKKKL